MKNTLFEPGWWVTGTNTKHTHTHKVKVRSGISQGSFLELLLFLICLNKSSKELKSKLNRFQDDADIVREIRSVQDLDNQQRPNETPTMVHGSQHSKVKHGYELTSCMKQIPGIYV